MNDLTPKEKQLISRIRSMNLKAEGRWMTPLNILFMAFGAGLYVFSLVKHENQLTLSGLFLFSLSAVNIERKQLYRIIQKTSANIQIEPANNDKTTFQKNKAIMMVVLAAALGYSVWKLLL